MLPMSCVNVHDNCAFCYKNYHLMLMAIRKSFLNHPKQASYRTINKPDNEVNVGGF